MKKHRKLVALLVALTFLFSVAAPAMAADASDAEKAAGKLEALGIIEGYPDGSFGLDREITRAEFAKVAVIASGHGDAGDILKSTPSKFSDVKTNEWYTGWINLAASQGYVKGYPDGTFRPNDKITNAEVVTVLLRLLGYNDNLPGDWPTNYIVKAVALEITKGISFDAKAFAVRGEVFMMADKALDTEMVKWDSDSQDFEGKDEKLIAKSFEGLMEDGLVTDISWDSKGVMSAEISGSAYEVSDDAIIAGAPDMLALLGSKVDFILNDDDEIVYAGAKETKTVSKNKATIGSKKITIDKKDYTLAEDFGVTCFPEDVDYEIGEEFSADNIVVVLDKKNNAEWAFVYDYKDGDIFDEIDGNYLVLEYGASVNLKDKDYVVVKNGAIASLDDLEAGDLVYVIKNKYGLDYLIIASDETVEGTLDSISGDKKKVTVDGVTYDLKYAAGALNALISDDGGDDYDRAADLLGKDMVGEEVSLLLSPTGKVAVLVSSVEAGEDIFVLFLNGTKKDWSDFGKKEIEVLNTAGKKVIYTVAKKDAWEVLKVGSEDGVKNGDLLKIELNSDGEIKAVTLASDTDAIKGSLDPGINGINIDNIDDDLDRIKLEGKWYRIADDAFFFVYDEEEVQDPEWTTVKWSIFEDADVVGESADYAICDGNKVKYLVVSAYVAGKGNHGIVLDAYYGKGDDYVVLAVEGGKEVHYVVDDYPSGKDLDSLVDGAYVEFNVVSSGEIEIKDIKSLEPEYIVTRVASDYIRVVENDGDDGEGYFDLDEDTTIVDLSGSSPEIVDAVVRGDYVAVVDEDKDGVAEFILIFEEPEEDGDVDDDNGVVGQYKVIAVAFEEGNKLLTLMDADGNIVPYQLAEGTLVELMDGTVERISEIDDLDTELPAGSTVDVVLIKGTETVSYIKIVSVVES
jgi:hypothetical protein